MRRDYALYENRAAFDLTLVGNDGNGIVTVRKRRSLYVRQMHPRPGLAADSGPLRSLVKAIMFAVLPGLGPGFNDDFETLTGLDVLTSVNARPNWLGTAVPIRELHTNTAVTGIVIGDCEAPPASRRMAIPIRSSAPKWQESEAEWLTL